MKAGWQVKKLGEVCELINGRAYSKHELLVNGKYPVLRVGNFFTNDNWYYSDLELNEDKYCNNGDLLYAWSASFGPRIWDKGKVIFHYHIWKVKHDLTIIDQKYLYWYFLWDIDKIKQDQGTGTTMIHVAKGSMDEREIPLPPLAEQQRIVAILDEVFDSIATAKANAEQNLKNARELFDSYLQSVFTQKGEGWVEQPLRQVCTIKPSKEEARKQLSPSSLVSFVPMEDLGIDQKYLVATQVRPLAEVIGSYTYFSENDVLLAKITPCFENGKLGIARELNNSMGFGSSEYVVFRPVKNLYNEFLYYFLSRRQFRAEGAQQMNGAVGHKRVSKEFIDAYPIPVPPLYEQHSIVARLDTLSAETQRLEAIYRQKIAALDELKQSLLQKAFAGEL